MHKAFDVVVAKTFFPKGIITSFEPLVQNSLVIGSSLNYIWFWIEGRTLFTNNHTGDTVTFQKSDNTIDKPVPQGEWTVTFEEGTRLLCASPHNNVNKIPLHSHLSIFYMESGSTRNIPANTKLFLGAGKIQTEDVIIEGPKQIHIKTSGKTVTAITDVFGFITL